MTVLRPEFSEEAEIIRLQGGEMPEVSLFDSLHQLKSAGLEPTDEELRLLESAAAERYMVIIRRDLDQASLPHSFFRGPQRAMVNLHRFRAFAARTDFALADFLVEAGRMLLAYLEAEAAAVRSGRLFNTIGMNRQELENFTEELGLTGRIGRETMAEVFSVKTLGFDEATSAVRAELEERGVN